MKTKYFFLFLIFCGIHLTCVAAKKQEPLTAVLIHELKCNSEKAYSYFIDFEKFGKLHPVIKETKKIKAGSGDTIGEYAIKEFIFLFGFIPLRPRYNATVIETEKGKKIKYTSQVKKGIYLEIVFEFSESTDKNSCAIKEEITIRGKHSTSKILLKQMKKKHLILVENLKKEIQV